MIICPVAELSVTGIPTTSRRWNALSMVMVELHESRSEITRTRGFEGCMYLKIEALAVSVRTLASSSSARYPGTRSCSFYITELRQCCRVHRCADSLERSGHCRAITRMGMVMVLKPHGPSPVIPLSGVPLPSEARQIESTGINVLHRRYALLNCL